MTNNQCICDIKTRLLLTEELLTQLIGKQMITGEKISEYKINNQEEGLSFINDKLTNTDILCIKKKINYKDYKTPFLAYTEILKRYYPKPCKIFILARRKNKNIVEKFLSIFLANTKKEISKEMAEFYPSYLIEKDKKKVILIFNKDFFELYELNRNIENNRFIFMNYNYVKANEIKLK